MSRQQQQQRDNNAETQMGADVDVDAEHDPEVSRRASNAGLRRQVQMKGSTASADTDQVQEAAQRGTAGHGTALPHAETIQKAFGSHDISDIRAHVGGNAQAATGAMGAEAYATGNQIAFAKQPDLHTAAHEAAHVVQQKKGVSLSGGVGQEGDAHEKHADAIADQVVAGKSVEHMLGAPATNEAPAAGQAVQKKDSDKPVVNAAAHSDAETASIIGSQSALKHLAVQFSAWKMPLSELENSQSAEGSGYEIAAQKIEAILTSMGMQIEMARQAVIASNRANRTIMAADAKAAQNAWNALRQVILPRAVAFLDKAEHKGWAPRTAEMERTVDGFTEQIGLTADEMKAVEGKVEGDEKSLAKAMIDDQVSGLRAAIESVKAGNEGDLYRINIHASYLDNVGKDEPAQLKSHHAQLKKLNAELAALHKEKPTLELGEAQMHLGKLAK